MSEPLLKPKKLSESGYFNIISSGHIELPREVTDSRDICIGLRSDKTIREQNERDATGSEDERACMLSTLKAGSESGLLFQTITN